MFKRKLVAKTNSRKNHGYFKKSHTLEEIKVKGCKAGQVFEQMLKVPLGKVLDEDD